MLQQHVPRTTTCTNARSTIVATRLVTVRIPPPRDSPSLEDIAIDRASECTLITPAGDRSLDTLARRVSSARQGDDRRFICSIREKCAEVSVDRVAKLFRSFRARVSEHLQRHRDVRWAHAHTTA